MTPTAITASTRAYEKWLRTHPHLATGEEESA
jgi:hypothetical protein